MNSQQPEQQSFDTQSTCPLCHETLAIHWQGDNIPYFGEVMYITTLCCNCGFRFADTMILGQKEPMRYEMTVEDVQDLNARVIRSTSGTIRLPELGIDVEPGLVSDSYVTNIEGVLDRIKNVVMTATRWASEDEAKYNHGLELQKTLEDVMDGKQKLKIVIEDPLGNSAIISDKAICKKLDPLEAGNLKTGMIIYDVNSEEITVDQSDNAQPLGG